MIYSDRNLSKRIERTEAHVNASFIESRAKLSPKSGAEWIEVAGAYAMFDGAHSPCTQTFGLGMFEEVTSAELEEIEILGSRGRKVLFLMLNFILHVKKVATWLSWQRRQEVSHRETPKKISSASLIPDQNGSFFLHRTKKRNSKDTDLSLAFF